MGKGRRLRALRVLRARDAREAYLQAEAERAAAKLAAKEQLEFYSATAEMTRSIVLSSQACRPILDSALRKAGQATLGMAIQAAPSRVPYDAPTYGMRSRP